tara:strand:+ start:2294 stop:4810 length:2517 start_codon:yes stop_codon:yes gene_type:complete
MKIFYRRFTALALIYTLLVISQATLSDEIEEDNQPKDSNKEYVKEMNHYKGLIDIYQNPKNAETYFKIKKDQLNQEYIYFSHVIDGIVEGRKNRGSYLDNGLIKFVKIFNSIRLIRINSSFKYDEDNPLSNSQGANISDAIIEVFPIKSQNEDEYIIDVTSLFLSESLTNIKPLPNPENPHSKGLKWGKINSKKSLISRIQNYPNNSDLEVEYLYENSPISESYGKDKFEDIIDSRNIILSLRYSFIKPPSNNFEPRYADQRVGFFSQRITNLTSKDITPYADLIHKWFLEKKEPDKEFSEPIKPITFWIENTAPKELIPYIKEGVLAWNNAFKKAGFLNALDVKLQPDDADWDAGDIRYNVIRWTSSPKPPFGGYGPSFVNPRTGEILGADIMLEWVYLTNRLFVDSIFSYESYNSIDSHSNCSIDSITQRSNFLATLVSNSSSETESKIIEQGIISLVLHEVGHTLGLNHNFKASYLHDPVSIHDQSITSKEGVTSSVMDYAPTNLAPLGKEQGDYYDTFPGVYDDWAIEFAYTPDLGSDSIEKILSKSVDPKLMFGNDADDMRGPGRGIDPRAMVSDLSNDPIQYAEERIQLINKTLSDLPEKFNKKATSWEQYRKAYMLLTTDIGRSLETASRYIGGVYVNRSFPDQDTDLEPFEPVPYKVQKKAMQMIAKHAFAPDAFTLDKNLASKLQLERRGFDFYGEHEDPQILRRILSIQTAVMNHLLDGWMMYRLSDSEYYGNSYSSSEMLRDLTDAIFLEDISSPINAMRRNLQIRYVRRLLNILSQDYYDDLSVTAAYSSLRYIEKIIRKNSRDQPTMEQRSLLSWLIESGLDRAQ